MNPIIFLHLEYLELFDSANISPRAVPTPLRLEYVRSLNRRMETRS